MSDSPSAQAHNHNLYAALRAAFPADLDAVAVETDNGLYYSWRDLDRASAMLANLLVSLGLADGARIAVQVEKSVEAMLLYLLAMGSPTHPARDDSWEAFCAEKPALSAVLTRSLSENPEQRHQAVEELVAELEAVSLIGGPLRRRPGPTPLAMAVAAGRLPQEELNRPVEDLVPENRRRRNSGAFEIGSVLLPLASSPSGRSSAVRSSQGTPSRIRRSSAWRPRTSRLAASSGSTPR